MSRSNSNALESGDANDFAYGNEQPTKRLPMLTPFDLAQEARRLDDEARMRDEAARAALDDEPTLDAPSPVTSVEPKGEPASTSVPVRITARPPALRGLVLTRPAPPKSTPRVEVSSIAVISASAVPAIAAAPATPAVLASQPVSALAPKRTTETYLVAGIWATAMTLLAILMFMTSSA